jgi:hypothetical protein
MEVHDHADPINYILVAETATGGQPTQMDHVRDSIPFLVSVKHACKLEEVTVSSSCADTCGTACKSPTTQSDICVKHIIKYDQKS